MSTVRAIAPVSITLWIRDQLLSCVGEDFGQERTLRKWRFKDWNEEVEAESFPEWLIEFLEWWEENVEDSQTIGGAYAVEHRYADDIIEGFTEVLQT